MCVCVRIARARANYSRPAHCTRALCLLTVRARCTRTVRADCTQKVCAKICCVFFKICCLLLRICCGFSKSAVIFYTCGPHVWWPYGTGRARARTVCTRARARANCTRGARALYVRTARAHCTYRTRTVRPDCTQKVCAKICCVLFKICCVFFQNLLCFSKSAVFFCTYGPRVRWPYGTARARARAVYVRATRVRARKPHARAPCARAVRTVCANRTRGLYGKSVCQISLCCFQNLMVFFQYLLRFFQFCGVLFARTSAHMVVVRYGTRACGAHVRAARTRARVRCTAHARGVRVRSAQCACMARVRLMSVAQPARSAADAFEPSFRSLGLLCFLSNKKYPHSLTPM